MASLIPALDRLFFRQLCATPRGRAHLYRQLAEAEGGNGGELMLFDHLLAQTSDDPEIARLIRRHYDDELRHERLYSELADATGLPAEPQPTDGSVLLALDEELGLFSNPIRTREDVMNAYLVLLVVEERATTQFGALRDAVRPHDEHAAGVIDEIERDEARHLRYCEAISRRYAPDEPTRQRRLAEVRAAEARAFARVQRANLRHTLDAGLIQPRRWRLFWGALRALSEVRGPLPAPAAAPAA
jgi:rubrerythrin